MVPDRYAGEPPAPPPPPPHPIGRRRVSHYPSFSVNMFVVGSVCLPSWYPFHLKPISIRCGQGGLRQQVDLLAAQPLTTLDIGVVTQLLGGPCKSTCTGVPKGARDRADDPPEWTESPEPDDAQRLQSAVAGSHLGDADCVHSPPRRLTNPYCHSPSGVLAAPGPPATHW